MQRPEVVVLPPSCQKQQKHRERQQTERPEGPKLGGDEQDDQSDEPERAAGPEQEELAQEKSQRIHVAQLGGPELLGLGQEGPAPGDLAGQAWAGPAPPRARRQARAKGFEGLA